MTEAEIKANIAKLEETIATEDNTEDKKELQAGLDKLKRYATKSKLKSEEKKVTAPNLVPKKKMVVIKKKVIDLSKKKISIKTKESKERIPVKKTLLLKRELSIEKGEKKETHKTQFDKDIAGAILVLNKERFVIKEIKDRKTKKVDKVKHSPEYKNARTIEKRINAIFNSSIYDIAKTKKEKQEKKAFIGEINQLKELTTLWLNEVDMIINQGDKSDIIAIKNLLIGLIREAQKNDPSDKYKFAGGLDKIAKKYGFLEIKSSKDVGEIGIYYLVRENKKIHNPATYKQYKYLETFENVKMTINTSQFIKYIDLNEASNAIEAATKGKKVVVE